MRSFFRISAPETRNEEKDRKELTNDTLWAFASLFPVRFTTRHSVFDASKITQNPSDSEVVKPHGAPKPETWQDTFSRPIADSGWGAVALFGEVSRPGERFKKIAVQRRIQRGGVRDPLDPPDIEHTVSRTLPRPRNGQQVVLSDDLSDGVGIQPPARRKLRLRKSW